MDSIADLRSENERLRATNQAKESYVIECERLGDENERLRAEIAVLQHACDEWRKVVESKSAPGIDTTAGCVEPVAWAVYVGYEKFKAFDTEEDAIRWHRAETQYGSSYAYKVVPLYAAPQQRQPLVDDIVRPLIDDTSEVFFANGSETPQVVRDVIEYVQSWLEVYFDKHGITGEPT